MRTLAGRADLTAQTHEALRSAIVSGELSPCAPLAQEELAERLGVSRQPISHALKLLKREGLVVDRGRKGQMVAPIDADRLVSLYQVRGALDRLAAQLAADKAPVSSSVDGQLKKLLEQGSRSAASGDITAMVRADVRFHQVLHSISGNHEIATATELLWSHIERAMHTVLTNHPARTEIWEEHKAIAEAVLAGDATLAGELSARHAEQAGITTGRRLLDLHSKRQGNS